MARDLSEAIEILNEHGLDFVNLVQDTNTETMMKIGALLDGSLEYAIKTHRMNCGQNIDEKMFAKDGKLGTFGAKIKKAKNLGLLDDGQFNDADLLREIRNEFGHRETKIHFDSPEIVECAQKLSTYEAAESVQSAIFAATDRVMSPLKSYVKQSKEAILGDSR